MDTKVRIIPSIGYQDAKNAVKWLCEAFDFKENALYETEDGKVAHAQLTYKGNMIMLGSSDNGSEFSKLTKLPTELGGFVTQSPYIIIDDHEIEAHYEKAKSHGAEILLALKSEDYGGKNYTCKDPEGHIWNFGSYDPWRT
nr:glyoxalase [Cytophagales bacterium]